MGRGEPRKNHSFNWDGTVEEEVSSYRENGVVAGRVFQAYVKDASSGRVKTQLLLEGKTPLVDTADFQAFLEASSGRVIIGQSGVIVEGAITVRTRVKDETGQWIDKLVSLPRGVSLVSESAMSKYLGTILDLTDLKADEEQNLIKKIQGIIASFGETDQANTVNYLVAGL